MRQLAAIVFADMVGYTALMQADEHAAREKRSRVRKVMDSALPDFRGRILQQYGDGTLCIFNSAVDAVLCATTIQRQLLQAPTVELRVGIHMADVTIEDDAIYGDGVNLASRIESLAVPGSVLISEKVYDEIRNQNIASVDLGFFEFKNVLHPMRVFAIANPGIVMPARASLNGKTRAPVNRLAVLPFVNMSADPENEFFSDGITEEILNTLAQVEGLQVTSRTSVFAFKGKQSDIRDIALQLNVDKVLEGSVRKAGNRVRITAQLINAIDGFHLWSETYDRDLTDIFQVQDEISGIITARLRQDLATERQSPRSNAPVRNVNAYTLYLKGLHYWNRVTPADAHQAIRCFQEAIVLEPTYALAHAMTALAYSYLGSAGQILPSEAFAAVHQYADRAIELDDSIAEGYVAKGAAYILYEWNWELGFQALQNARRANPGSPAGSDLLAFYYVLTGNTGAAIETMEAAVELDPLSAIMNQALGNAYLFAERYDEAIRQAEKILEMNPAMRSCLELKAWATGMKGDWQGALSLFEEVHRLTGHPLKGLMGLGFAYAKLGEREKALDCIRKLEQRKVQEPKAIVEADLVTIWFGLGDIDKTIYYIRECMKMRMAPIEFFVQYPQFKTLRDDPRYLSLLGEMSVK